MINIHELLREAATYMQRSDPEFASKLEAAARFEEISTQHEQGFQGACYACEPVGELNVKLEARIAEIERQNKKLIDTLHDAKALLVFWFERNGYHANDFDNTVTMRDINKLLAGTDEET